jgi:hypothetical protein
VLVQVATLSQAASGALASLCSDGKRSAVASTLADLAQTVLRGLRAVASADTVDVSAALLLSVQNSVLPPVTKSPSASVAISTDDPSGGSEPDGHSSEKAKATPVDHTAAVPTTEDEGPAAAAAKAAAAVAAAELSSAQAVALRLIGTCDALCRGISVVASEASHLADVCETASVALAATRNELSESLARHAEATVVWEARDAKVHTAIGLLKARVASESEATKAAAAEVESLREALAASDAARAHAESRYAALAQVRSN